MTLPNRTVVPIYSGYLVYFPFPGGSTYVSVRFSLLPSFSVVVDYRLVILCFISSIYFGVSNTVFLILSLGFHKQDVIFYFHPFPLQDVIFFFLPLSSTLLYKCTTFSLSILWLRGIYVSRFWLVKIMLVWT